MTRLADYAITAVHYSTNPKHIESVKARKLNDDNQMAEEQIYARSAIVKAINVDKVSFITVTYQNGKYQTGAKVEVENVNGTDYLHTVRDGTTKDNLGNLPTF